MPCGGVAAKLGCREITARRPQSESPHSPHMLLGAKGNATMANQVSELARLFVPSQNPSAMRWLATCIMLVGLASTVCAQDSEKQSSEKQSSEQQGSEQQNPEQQPRAADPVAAKKPAMTVDERDGTVSFSMNESLELVDFVRWAQQVTGMRFTYNSQELGNGIAGGSRVRFFGTFRIPRERFQEDFYAFFQTMLYTKGFAVIPRGEGGLELLEIVMMNGPRGREVSSSARHVAPEDLANYRFQTGVPILTTLPLKHINAQLARNTLRPFFASTGGNFVGSVQIGNVGNKSALLLQGFGPQVHAAARMIQLVDEPSAELAPEQVAAATDQPDSSVGERMMQVVELEHVDPEVMAQIVASAMIGKPIVTAEAQASKGADTADEANTMEFSMADKDGMELLDFIQWTQEVTGKRFTFNPVEIELGSSGGSKVNFLGTIRASRDRFREEFFAFFQTMLYTKGFAVVPRGEGHLELLEIVMMAGIRGREVSNSSRYVPAEELGSYRSQTGVPILTSVTLKNINAQQANNALRPFFASAGGKAGSSVQFGSVGNKSGLLLQGFGPQVHAAVQFLALVDMPAKQQELLVKAMMHNGKQAVAVRGTQEQLRKALEVIATADVPGSAAGKVR